jgi:hypothetical protein
MHVDLFKLEENHTFVVYRFEVEIVTNIIFDGAKKPTYETITKVGFCKFNKISEEFELDLKKTDPYFLSPPHSHYEVRYVRVELIIIKRKGLEFPEWTSIQKPG